eukprot:jgi/Mesen1/2271/ME000154S01440
MGKNMDLRDDEEQLLPSTQAKGKDKPRPMTKKGMLAAASYMLCAVMLVMFNKAALSSYKFPSANVVTLLQMICSNLLLYTLCSCKVVSLASDSSTNLGSGGFVPVRILKRVWPLSISYLFYMVVGMASIRGVNVPMYTSLRRTTVVFTMAMEYFIAGLGHTRPVVGSVVIILVGAVIAGSSDITYDPYSYAMVFLSNMTTAIYLACIAKLGKSTGLNSFGLMWCNGIICGPILLAFTFASGELSAALHFEHLHKLLFQGVIAMSCILAFALNYTIFLNTSLNSPLTQTMCGNLKDLGTVALGWVWFGGLPFDAVNIFGQGLGFLGSGLYAYCKLRGK